MNNYEYIDHTADIQVHAWGNSLEEAFTECAHAMLNYMYERESVTIQENHEISVEGSSLNMLLYNFLEEVLYSFSCDPNMAIHTVQITSISQFSDRNLFRLDAVCNGEEYERRKHGSKTEIKAVTFSNMRIETTPEGKVDIYIIFDI